MMRPLLTLFLISAVSIAASPAAARSMHKHQPLAFEALPPVCQEYFKRAETCYAKVGDKALFQRGNTTFLRQSLPAADEKQRVKMCEIALHDFPEKIRKLKCE